MFVSAGKTLHGLGVFSESQVWQTHTETSYTNTHTHTHTHTHTLRGWRCVLVWLMTAAAEQLSASCHLTSDDWPSLSLSLSLSHLFSLALFRPFLPLMANKLIGSEYQTKSPFSLCLSVMNKGQSVTKYYRWIQKNGGYIWIQSSATIAINAKNASEKNIIWVNYVLRSELAIVADGLIQSTRFPN